jgi:hypothetical protein
LPERTHGHGPCILRGLDGVAQRGCGLAYRRERGRIRLDARGLFTVRDRALPLAARKRHAREATQCTNVSWITLEATRKGAVGKSEVTAAQMQLAQPEVEPEGRRAHRPW